MDNEPDVVGAEILVDVDQDKDTRDEDAENNVRPLWDGVCGVEVRIEQDQDNKDYAWEEKRQDQEIDIHKLPETVLI